VTDSRVFLICRFLPVAIVLATIGCDGDTSPRRESGKSSILAKPQHNTSSMVIDSISRTLNHLPEEVVTELTPPRVILDDSKSANGLEILAILDVTPEVPDGPFNYLSVPEGNANFSNLKVQAGDVVRYFVKYDLEDLEQGFENVTYLELTVRRLDANNPQNALIVEGGLNGRVDVPHRIEIWRFSDKRMIEIYNRISRHYSNEPKPLVGWEPSPDESALVHVVDRLNHWWRNLPDEKGSWQASRLVEKLPDEIRKSKKMIPLITDKALEENDFEAWEGRLLQEAIWLRDISTWAKADGLADLEVAGKLFDWTIRNIQLDRAGNAAIIHHPWQALMYGHGTAEDRAWVFAELCRQQQLDVVMLAVATGEDQPKWWLPALMSDGKLHLFDTHLGLPLPGVVPGSVATLDEVASHPELLDQLAIEGADPYPISASAFQQEEGPRVTAWLVASHLQLSHRAATLQQTLKGENFVVLAADIQRIEEELETMPDVAEVELWPYPFISLIKEFNANPAARSVAALRFLIFAQRPRLWKARVLHFQGNQDIPSGESNDPLAQPNLGHREATELYQNRRVRPGEDTLDSLEPAQQEIYRTCKADASYWLGLLSFDVGNYKVASQWLEMRTLKANPNGPWTAGARYNLARVYEALGKPAEAIELLEQDDSPQRHGNLLRARQLRKTLDSAE
jgi:tetratricopeptide (TPR) repeat protein